MKTKRTILLSVALLGGVVVALTLALLMNRASVVLAAPGTLYVAPGGNCNGASPCYGSIQEAVDSATAGDEVRVAAGTYTDINVRPRDDVTTTGTVTQVVYISKTITVQGGYSTTDWTTPDPDTNPTTLDAQGRGRVLYIAGNITPTVKDLLITGGDATGLGGVSWEADVGGGVYVYAAAVTISNCVIYGNTASTAGEGYGGGGCLNYASNAALISNTVESNTATSVADANAGGGGLYIRYSHNATVHGNSVRGNSSSGLGYGGGMLILASDLALSDNLVEGNVASANWNGYGGGLAMTWSTSKLSSNSFISNSASTHGGGVYLYEGNSTLTGNTIMSNTANSVGGGAFVEKGAPTLSNNTLEANFATWYGGGLFVWSEGVTLTGNIAVSNTATDGGGIYLNYSSATLSGNIAEANMATADGGGLYMYASDATLVNNVVIDNQAYSNGSGVYIAGSTPRMLHTTIARNSGGDGSGIYVTNDPYNHVDSDVVLTNTLLVSHTVGISVTSNHTVTVNGILWDSSTPATILQEGTAAVTVQNQRTGDPVFAVDGHRVTPASDAIDAGVDAGVTDDIDGEARLFGAGVDLGADEWATAETTAGPSAPAFLTVTVRGLTSTVDIPSQAVTEIVRLEYTALAYAAHDDPADLVFAEHAFDLEVYQEESLLIDFVFSRPVTITIHYEGADLDDLAEGTLVLEYWDEGTDSWVDAACGDYDRHVGEDWLTVPIRHSGRFALFAEEQRKVYLPLVMQSD